MIEEGFDEDNLIEAIGDGEILEDYPNEKRCLKNFGGKRPQREVDYDENKKMFRMRRLCGGKIYYSEV
ncbi:MAG: hypothetical protein HY266_00705 [Deltaproteobacteria bacterium]|nr:hypothetical protein [Deltaproteobacteria bacterium]